jgi:hypothetical protein
MITAGESYKTIHIMTHIRHDKEDVFYEGYREPVFYYKTSDGGVTWDKEGVLMPEAAGISWHEGPSGRPSYTDAISMAQYGNTIAVSFIRFGYHNYILKSVDNGDNWTAIQFFHSSVRYYGEPSEYADTCLVPTHGVVAVDIKGKVHVVFGNRQAYNGDDEGSLWLVTGYFTSFLSYWNEDMPPLDGDDFIAEDMQDIMFDKYIDEDLTTTWEKLYIKSTTPEWPIIGFYTPTDNVFTAPASAEDFKWIQTSYGRAGTFSFPQMAFDRDNTMHLSYLGIFDGGSDDSRWLRHPFYTTRTENNEWTPTKYLVNTINLIDREFAYLTLSGLYDNKMFLMAQVDQYAGVYTPYVNDSPDHDPVTNYYYSFNVFPVFTPYAINEVDYTPLTMTVYPNPASGQVTVSFEGIKGNITVYNMLGQAVYHAKNVENQQNISLNELTTGVYFVTLRSGNATATQKLIVK